MPYKLTLIIAVSAVLLIFGSNEFVSAQASINPVRSLHEGSDCSTASCADYCCDAVNARGCSNPYDCEVCGGNCAACVAGGYCGWSKKFFRPSDTI